MVRYKANVVVTLKDGIRDPQGSAVATILKRNKIEDKPHVGVGKFFTLEVEEETEETETETTEETPAPRAATRGRPRNAVKAAAVEETEEEEENTETTFEDDTGEEEGGEEDPPLSKYNLAQVKKALKAFVIGGKPEQERAKKFLKKCGAGHIDDLSPKYFAEAIKTFQ